MSTNVEIGARLKSERQRIGLTQEELAFVTSISKTSQVNYESGKRTPDAMYLSDAKKAGLDIDYIVSGVKSAGQDEDLVMIPMLDVSAGAGVGAVMSEASEYKVDGLCFSRAWIAKRNLNPDQLRVIDVRGKSMEGILADGDRVLVNLQDTKPRSGFVYVIRQGDELLVKYCQLLPGGMLRLSSENPQFQPYDIDLERTDDVAIIGRVVTSVHNW